MIKPAIGRVILFNDGISDQRVPGLITYVHSDTCINVGCFDQHGSTFTESSVKLCQGDEECEAGQAEWMPYQKQNPDRHTEKSAN